MIRAGLVLFASFALSACIPEASASSSGPVLITSCAVNTSEYQCRIYGQQAQADLAVLVFEMDGVTFTFMGPRRGSTILVQAADVDGQGWVATPGSCEIRRGGAKCLFNFEGHRFVVQNVPNSPLRLADQQR